MSSFGVSAVSDVRPADFALARDAADKLADQIAEVRQQKVDAVRTIAESSAQQRVAAQDERTAEAAGRRAALVQATAGTPFNVYA